MANQSLLNSICFSSSLSSKEEGVIGKEGKKIDRGEIFPGDLVPEIGKVFQKHSLDVITETEDGQTHPLTQRGLAEEYLVHASQGRETLIG